MLARVRDKASRWTTRSDVSSGAEGLVPPNWRIVRSLSKSSSFHISVLFRPPSKKHANRRDPEKVRAEIRNPVSRQEISLHVLAEAVGRPVWTSEIASIKSPPAKSTFSASPTEADISG